MRILDGVWSYKSFSEELAGFVNSVDRLAILVPQSRFLTPDSVADVMRRSASLLAGYGKEIVGFGDAALAGPVEFPILTQAELDAYRASGRRVGVFGPFNPHHEMDQAEANLAPLGYPFFDLTLAIIHGARVTAGIPAQAAPMVEAAAALLADDESRRILRDLLVSRHTGRREKISQSTYGEYAHPYIDFAGQSVMVDAGASVGSTSVDFLEKSPNAKVFAFEPLAATFDALTATRQAHRARHDRWVLENGGIWSHDTQMSMFGEGLGARMSEGDGVAVHALDSYFSDSQPPSLIKMDIEGSEYEALLGCRGIISKHKPDLIICAYHLDDDLWSLLFLIASMNPAYRFYLGHHGDILYETVLYAL